MQQPASTIQNLSSGVSWQARNSSVGDGNVNSDGDSPDVELNDQSSSDSIGRLIHEGNNGISMNSSPDTSNANFLSSPIATEPDDHMTGSEGADMVVLERFENIAVGIAPFALGNHQNESNPAELKLANEIVELKIENAYLRSRVEQLEQSHSESSFLKSQIDKQQKEFQQLKQVSAELQLGVCKRDMLNENQCTKIVQLSTQCDQLELHCDKLYEKMETLERGHKLAQEKSVELQTELDKRNEENMRQIDTIKQLTIRFTESEESAKKNLEKISILEKEQNSLCIQKNEMRRLLQMTKKELEESRERLEDASVTKEIRRKTILKNMSNSSIEEEEIRGKRRKSYRDCCDLCTACRLYYKKLEDASDIKDIRRKTFFKNMSNSSILEEEIRGKRGKSYRELQDCCDLCTARRLYDEKNGHKLVTNRADSSHSQRLLKQIIW